MFRDPPDRRIPVASALTDRDDRFIKHFGYRPRGTDYFELRGDVALFINHSSNPNLSVEPGGDLVTSRAIKEGEELTLDYHDLEENPMRMCNPVRSDDA